MATDILVCDILEHITDDKTHHILIYVRSEGTRYTIPIKSAEVASLKIGSSYCFKKRIDSRSKEPKFSLIGNSTINSEDARYEVGKVYEFEILKIENKEHPLRGKLTIITLKTSSSSQSTVLGARWHKLPNWKFNTLHCEVKEIAGNGYLTLINRDVRHPNYDVGKIYEFDVAGARTKQLKEGTIDVLELEGVGECRYEVPRLPMQQIEALPKKVLCKVKKIGKSLRLTQIGQDDPYFSNADDIFINKSDKAKFFDPLFTKLENLTLDERNLIHQYKSKSAFWIFTFVDKILPENLKSSLQRRNYRQAFELNNLLAALEQWILKHGIIRSIADEDLRDATRIKVKAKIEDTKVLNLILLNFIDGNFQFLDDDHFFKGDINLVFRRLSYGVLSCDLKILSAEAFVRRMSIILSSPKLFVEQVSSQLRRLLHYISRQKKNILSEIENDNFGLATTRSTEISLTPTESEFLLWSYAELLISQYLQYHEHGNILCGQMLRLCIRSVADIEDKQRILINAYLFFDNYQAPNLAYPFEFDGTLNLMMEKLLPYEVKSQEALKEWKLLGDFFENDEEFEVSLIQKSTEGFKVKFGNLRGFLPNSNVKSRRIRNYGFEEFDITIRAKCRSMSTVFNTFIIEEANSGDKNRILNYKNAPKYNTIYDAIITQVKDYGFFVSTPVGEGLVYITDIFPFKWNRENIYDFFKKNQKIKVCLAELETDSKIKFSFVAVKDFDKNYYESYLECLFNNTKEGLFAASEDIQPNIKYDKSLNEKSFCIEQYAIYQTNIDEKLHNFRIARQFYQNAKNARSFLLNVYTSYFEIMQKIREVLNDRSVHRIDTIRLQAQEIKDSIDKKTLEKFPDSEKLIFFLSILSLFNQKDEISNSLLFEYIKKYNKVDSDSELRTIAKITLANNLLNSESTEDSDFCLRNLRLIFDYLSNGIFSLEDTLEDRNAREHKEEMLYLKGRINGDESEILELKSSFFTPILDSDALKKLEVLRKQEKQTEQIKIEISKLEGDLAKKRILHSTLKTLVAFANTSGGTLLIGVNDQKEILGLEREFKSFSKKADQNRDGFGKFFDNTIKAYIGDSFSSLMKRRFVKFPEGDILVVDVQKSRQEVFLLKGEDGKDLEQLYIRNLSSSKELTGSELVKFIKNRHVDEISKALVPN